MMESEKFIEILIKIFDSWKVSAIFTMDAKTVLCSKFVRPISSDEYFVLNTFHTISVLELGRSLAITISVKFPLVSKTELQKAKTIIEAQGILLIIYDLIIIL